MQTTAVTIDRFTGSRVDRDAMGMVAFSFAEGTFFL
jgi:hypothetical protein